MEHHGEYGLPQQPVLGEERLEAAKHYAVVEQVEGGEKAGKDTFEIDDKRHIDIVGGNRTKHGTFGTRGVDGKGLSPLDVRYRHVHIAVAQDVAAELWHRHL